MRKNLDLDGKDRENEPMSRTEETGKKSNHQEPTNRDIGGGDQKPKVAPPEDDPKKREP
jgi:hypothetical protein